MTTHLRPPRRYRRLIDRVMQQDREYFERHPEATERVRPYVPGEVWPLHHLDATHVLVTQLAPGIRTWLPLLAEKRARR